MRILSRQAALPGWSETSRLESSCQTEEETCRGAQRQPCLSLNKLSSNIEILLEIKRLDQEAKAKEKRVWTKNTEEDFKSFEVLQPTLGAPWKTNVLSPINRNFSVQFIAIQ